MAKRQTKKVNRRAKGEGSIYWYEPRQCYAAQVTVGTGPDGQQKRSTVYGKTEAIVVEKKQRLEMERNLGARIDVNKVTFGGWLDRWLIDYMKLSLKPTAYLVYETNLRLHVKPQVGHIALKALQASDLQTLFNNLLKDGRAAEEWNKGVNPGLSLETVYKIRTIVKSALRQAVDNDLIIKNPASATKLPPMEKKEVVPFTREEAEYFLNSIKSNRMFAAYYLALFTGLRRGEILGLMWSDIDFKAGNFEVKRELVSIKDEATGKYIIDFQPPKTKKSQRTIPLTEDLIKVLKSHKARQNEEKLFYGAAYHDEKLVFCTEEGHRIWPRNFDRQYTGLLKNAGIAHKKLHTTRHTFASMMIEDGEDIRNVQEILGHAKLSTTADIYSHVAERTKKKAMNRMAGLLNVQVD